MSLVAVHWAAGDELGGPLKKALLAAVRVVVLLVVLTPTGATAAQTEDPVGVVAAFEAALDAGNVEAALALLADDAVVTAQSGVYRAKGPIRGYLEGLVAQNYHAEVDSRDVAADTVTTRGRASLDDWRRLGVAPLEVVAEVVVRTGKIRTLSAALTPAAAARLQAAQARVAATPAQLPRVAPRAATEAGGRLQGATATQATTRARLRVLGDAASCAEARFVSYRRSDAEPEIVDQWYVAAQLWADAILLSAATAPGGPRLPSGWGEAEARCHLDKAFIFLDRLWDDATGGYYPRSNPAGTSVERALRHTDDNSLAGLALLSAAEVAPDPASRQRYLHAAQREAEFLIGSGLWDGTFGGGFWWNTDKGAVPEGKPAQSNSLAAMFFARLYDTTGVDTHRTWALRTLLWLDTILYDPTRQLYRWGVSHADPAGRLGTVVHDRYFNYDQGIAIEAQLLAAKLDRDPNRLTRARAVGRALHATFWGRERGGYNLELGIEQVYTAFAAWASLGHLALYNSDGDARWLEMARLNADALAASLREPDGGYAYRHYHCVDRGAPGCESGLFPWVVDRARDTAAQALMQHLQTALGQHVGPSPPSRGR